MALNARIARRAARTALFAVALYYAVWGGEYSAFDLWRLERMQRAEQVALAESRVEVDSLRRHAAALQDDPATIERLARERFGLIRPGEVLYRFIEVDSAAALRVATSP